MWRDFGEGEGLDRQLLCCSPRSPTASLAAAAAAVSVSSPAAPPELLRPPTALLALEDAACGQGNAANSSNGPGEGV